MKLSSSAPKKALFFYGCSALIPMGLMLAALYLLKIAPFGDDTLVFLDAESQYIKFLACLPRILSGEGDLLYTFSKNLGGDMISLAAYYLLSPFNLLFSLFCAEDLPVAFTAVIVLKLSACGLSYYHAASRLYGHRVLHLPFSTAYALMAYNVVYCWNIMWLDGVMILPLMSLGLTELRKNGKWKLYAFTIAWGLLTNFYIGYMLCIGSVLFFAVLLALEEGTLRERARCFGSYAAASCIGGFAAAPVWLPAFLSVIGSRTSGESQALDFAHVYRFSGLIDQLFSGTADWTDVVTGQPHLFCGTAILLLTGIFFLSRRTPVRAKLAVGALLLVFFASFRIRQLDVAWHGFSPNRSFNYRYSFLFSFLLIRIAHHTLLNISGRRSIVAACLGVCALWCYVFRRDPGAPELLVGVAVLLLCAGLLLLRSKGKSSLPGLVIAALCIGEMGLSLFFSWGTMLPELSHLSLQAHREAVGTYGPVYEELQKDPEFFRIEQSLRTAQNDPMLFGYSGMSHFSSAGKPGVMGFLEKLGYKNCYNVWSNYGYGSTADADALLGIRYILSPMDLTGIKGYPRISQEGQTPVYENPNALPIAMLADPALSDVSMDSRDYFSLHNAIWSGILGRSTEVLHPENQVQVTFENLQPVSSDDVSTFYTKIDEAAPALVRFEITVSREAPLYAYFTSQTDDQDVFLTVNGNDGGIYFNAFRWDMFTLGTYSPGQTVTVEMHLSKNELDLGGGYFYYEDLEALSGAAGEIRRKPVVLQKHSDSRLEGSFTADRDQLLLLTIPYDEGWVLTLDGEAAAGFPVLDSLMAVPVSSGTHTFRLHFVPRGLVPGSILSLTALLAAALWLFAEQKKKIR